MDKAIDSTSIRLNAIKSTYSKDTEAARAINRVALRFGISVDAVYLGLLLAEVYNDTFEEIKYAIQCDIKSDKIEDVLRQCVTDNTLQPLKMLYAEKGGGTE